MTLPDRQAQSRDKRREMEAAQKERLAEIRAESARLRREAVARHGEATVMKALK